VPPLRVEYPRRAALMSTPGQGRIERRLAAILAAGMRRREFIALVGGAVAWPTGLYAQQATGKVHRIGYLAGGSSTLPFHAAFREGLRELGWVEGHNIVIDYRFAEGQYDRLPGLADELVRLKVDIIVAAPTAAAVVVKKATEAIPIVMISIGDPVGLGLIASLARPGGNVTGVSYSVGLELFGKQLELLKETIPMVRRVAILSNPANPAQARAIENVKAAAESLGVQLQLLGARDPKEFDDAFAAMAKERAGALLVVADAVFNIHRARLVDLAVKNRLPSMYGIRESVEAGGLMFYGHDVLGQARHAATFVDKIFKGAKPADLPVQQPTKFELVINLKTAQALGLTVPPSVLARADEVIE
jgi:putative tryptophan/tyrosine transport system substrate-binding protein